MTVCVFYKIYLLYCVLYINIIYYSTHIIALHTGRSISSGSLLKIIHNSISSIISVEYFGYHRGTRAFTF